MIILLIRFYLKKKGTYQTSSNGAENVEIIIPLIYFWRTLKIPLINCENNFMLIWYVNCVVSFNAAADQETTFAIRDPNFYVAAATLSTQDNAKLLNQLKLGFKRMIFRDKCQWKVSTQAGNQCLDCLIDPIFQ